VALSGPAGDVDVGVEVPGRSDREFESDERPMLNVLDVAAADAPSEVQDVLMMLLICWSRSLILLTSSWPSSSGKDWHFKGFSLGTLKVAYLVLRTVLYVLLDGHRHPV
jgi:hypothetical protein